MLNDDVDRYISLRHALGYKLVKAGRHLRAFACFAADRGETHIRVSSVLSWLAIVARTPGARARRLTDLILFARFVHAEDSRHEIPRADVKRISEKRPVPYIYTADEITRILEMAGKLRHQRPNPLRRQLYVMLFGLIAATGLRVSEALALKLDDIRDGGVLHIRETKFRKSRLVPLHVTVVQALETYLEARRQHAGVCDWLFPSVQHREMFSTTVNYTFRSFSDGQGLLQNAGNSLAYMIFVTPLQPGCWNSAEPSAALSLDTSSLCRPIWAMPISETPTGILRQRRK